MFGKIFVFLLFPFFLNAVLIKVPTEKYHQDIAKQIHPGHYPFITYLTFRGICDTIIDEYTEWFDPEKVEQGEIIYLNVWFLHWFIHSVHDHIPHPYILVTCDVGAWLPHPEFKKLLYDPKLAAWFSRNMVFSYHPKLFQLPMGQDLGLFVYTQPKMTYCLLEAIKNIPLVRPHLLYMCHFPRPHGDRDKIVPLFENEPYCFSRNHSDRQFTNIPWPQFYKEMSSSEFVISPLGLETDTVRTWEALVLGCIPIVEHTFVDPLYDRLPVVMVHDWKEVNQAFLEKKRQELKGRSLDEAYFDYWFDLIKNCQKKIQRNELSDTYLDATLFPKKDFDDIVTLLNQQGALNQLLVYKGYLTSLRPFQLSEALLFPLLLFDPYQDQEIFQNLRNYVKDQKLLKNSRQVFLFPEGYSFFDKINPDQTWSVFLDLTYYRTSLFVNFGKCVVEQGNFRQSLKEDLQTFYDRLGPNSVICGNMLDQTYVNEVLMMFCNENKIALVTQGSIWAIKK